MDPQTDSAVNAAMVSHEKHPGDVLVHEMENDSIIKNGTIAAMGVGLLPIPMLGLGGLLAVNLVMVNTLATKYNVPFRRNGVKAAVISLIGSALPMSLGLGFADMLKVIPGLGSVAGAAGTSMLAGAMTYSVGQAFDRHLASGGDFLTIDMQNLKQTFRDSMSRGRQVATDLATRSKSKTASAGETTPAPSVTSASPLI